MSKKKKVAPVVRPPTKRQLSRWQKQKRQQKIIFGIGMVIIAAVVALVGSGVYFGWYVPVQQPLRNTMLEVGDTKFTTRYFVDSVKYQLGTMLNGQWAYSWMYMDYVLSIVTNTELMRQEAEKLGIVVSDGEIDEYLKGHSDRKNPALRDIVRSSLLVQKLNDEYLTPQLPLSSEQRHILAMLLESQSQLDEVREELKDGADFGDLAEKRSLDQYTQAVKGDLGFRPREVISYLLGSAALEDVIFGQGIGTLSQFEDVEITKQLGYWLIMVTERDEDDASAYIAAMLLGSEEEALVVKARLENGEEFVALAEEFSLIWDENNQGNIGWLSRDDDENVMWEYAFDADTELNVVSSPIKDTSTNMETTGGFWLIEVKASENRSLSGENLDIVLNSLFSEWLSGVTEDARDQDRVTSYLDDERMNWVADYLTGALT